ncbi:hypothetical protein [Roseomonas sp. KE2513]|uniref:hypothetical protein n=1 Tax=Roseomonas sp. KE2513 TaxID=2479202 RepID=UPI001E54012E|nr:hypothetical protein [Roseomonas sp. KE2513]
MQEIMQIGGRAGRFGGVHAEGIVAVLAASSDPKEIALALKADPEAPMDLRPPVAPDAEIVAGVAEEIGTESLFGTLRRFERAVLRPDDPNYRLGDLSTQLAIAAEIDGVWELSLMDCGAMPCVPWMNVTRPFRGWLTGRSSMRWEWPCHRLAPEGCLHRTVRGGTRCSSPSGCIGRLWHGVGWRCAIQAPTAT